MLHREIQMDLIDIDLQANAVMRPKYDGLEVERGMPASQTKA